MQSTERIYETIERPAEIVTVRDSDTIAAAAIKMRTNRVGCLIVSDAQGKLVGIVTEQDIVNRAVASSMDLERTAIAKIMTTQVVSCPFGTPISKVREHMIANRIRHLPIVNGEVVVGMLSTRDVMAQQLLEDRAAAEQVAMLSTCLKSIDLDEVVNMVTSQVPTLFQARKCVLCFHRDGAPTKKPVLISYNKCTCAKEHLKRLEDIDELSGRYGFGCESTVHICDGHGDQSPSVVIPLTISDSKGTSSGKGESLSGYLCMCGLPESASTNRELISYKVDLVREVLNSHLTNAKLYQDIKQVSLTDTLTQVGSRELLEDRLEAERARSERYQCPFSVAVVDLDNFKSINDKLGHTSGDNALRMVADCMKREKRASDMVARYGGDEFVILMPETKLKDAVTLCERLRAKVQETPMPENLSVTISCGVVARSGKELESADELIRCADLALYEAKNAGRNRVKTWEETVGKLRPESNLETEKIKEFQERVSSLSVQSRDMFVQSIWGLIHALEAKDPYTKSHSENVMHYAVGIAETMKMDPQQVGVIRRAAMIHDIGKIGIPDKILSKPGKLTPDERDIIEQHPLIAVRILDQMRSLEREMPIVRHQNEHWDGRGYPDGLSGTAIPLGARVLAAADAFDAITSNRPYRDSHSLPEAMEILVEASGTQFDPKVIEGMVCYIEKVRQERGKTGELTPGDLPAYDITKAI